MTCQLAADSRESAGSRHLLRSRMPFVPAFIVEQLDGGRFTVLVPSVPTPLPKSTVRNSRICQESSAWYWARWHTR
jgi:hypothetical protein